MQHPDTEDGLFHSGNPLTGEKGTPITADWLNALLAIGALFSGAEEPPPAALGDDGDHYLYTGTPRTLYGPKTNGEWGAGVSIKGDQGIQGITGSPYASYATLAAANADLANIPANALVWVNNDAGTPTNNGFWAKTSGVLVQSPSQLTAIQNALPIPWLDPSQYGSTQWTATKWAIAKAITAIYIINPVAGYTYRITIFARNDATFKDRIFIADQNNNTIASGDGPFLPKTAGALTTVTLTGAATTFILLIDYNAAGLSDGLLLNQVASTTPLVINSFSHSVLIDQRVRSLETSNTTNAGNITTLQNQMIRWLDPAQYNSQYWTTNLKTLAKAVKAVMVRNPVAGRTYKFVTWCKNDAAFKDRIDIYDDLGNSVATTNSVVITKAGGGVLTPVTLNGVNGLQFLVLIDYAALSGLPDGILLNSVANTPMGIYLGDPEQPLDARIVALEDSVFAVVAMDNQAINGNLSNDGQGVAYVLLNVTGDGIVPMNHADLSSRGIEYGLVYSKGIEGFSALGGAYLQHALNSGDAEKYYFFSVYEYSESGADWGNTPSIYVYVNEQGGNINLVGANGGYTQVTPNLRKYWGTGQLPAGYTYKHARIGNVPAVAGNVYLSGLTFAVSDSAITESDVKVDQWLLNGATTLYDALDRLVSDEQRITALEESPAMLSVNPGKALRICCAGSSITWGNGYLGEDSYVGQLESRIRTRMAKTIHGKDMTISGSSTVVNHKLFYGGQVLQLTGVNAYAEASLFGDEISISFGRERKNSGAAIIEVYLDGVLHDTFSTYNPLPSGAAVANFVGDGNSKLFDLGKIFTYNHTVTVDGAAKVGSLNTQGYGGSIPGGNDYIVIRKYATVDGSPEVHHYLMFAAAPAPGSAVACTFDYGESVCYAKTTLGNTAQGFNSTLESAYGEGNVAFDPANPSSLSSGLDFRSSDHRSVLTWKFADVATRTVRFVVKQLDTRATGATPELWLNFLTNRMYHVQNAGIGGWTAGYLTTDTGLRTVTQIKEFAPDLVFIESGTNDDWNVANVWSAYVTKANLTEAQVKALGSSLHLQAITYDNPNYTVQDSRVPITAITPLTATLNGANATFNVQAGDVIILGDFQGDNRRMAARVISAWDAGTRVVTWKKPLVSSEIVHITSLSDLIGTSAQVRRISNWADSLTAALDSVEGDLPGVRVGIVDMGIPAWGARRLIGYPEKADDLAAARSKPCLRVKTASAVSQWQYGQKKDVQLYIDAAQSVTSTGAASYSLYTAAGGAPSDFQARHFSVLVDGVERINDGCHIEGGTYYNWGAVSPLDFNNDSSMLQPYRVVFTSDVPAPGSTIVVKHTSATWSGDETHPNTTGNKIFGEAIFESLKD